MKKIIFILIIILIAKNNLNAQGCVAIKSSGGYCTMLSHHDSTNKKQDWLLSINNRYYKSYKHFIGTVEQKQRQTLGTEVINHAYTMDINLQKKLNERWAIGFNIPIEDNSRSSLYEHNNVGRYLTHTFGVGDIRIAAYSWIINPTKMSKGNIQLGLGLKLPTGNYNCQDFFHITADSVRLGAVDQSIQLGDGGTGITFELNTFYNISHKFSLYGNFYYLSSPQQVNGTLSTRGAAPTSSSIQNYSYVMSVPDQYMYRAGLSYTLKNFTFSGGVRKECLPTNDLIGGSHGFRRPGFIVSAEPGVTYQFKKLNIYAYVPVAISRNRTQSVADKITTQLTGKYTQGDAAFADCAVNIGVTFKF